MSNSDIVLRVENLHKQFRKGFFKTPVEILKGVSFEVKAGKITGFLGVNGAGKTTTMKCLLGINFPDSGSIEFFGGEQLSSDVKARIGFLPERPYFYDYLTGFEFLQFYGRLSTNLTAQDLKKRIQELLDLVGLNHAIDRPLRAFSKGMLQRVGLAQALIHKPDFVILDEPMAGLDPDGRYHLAQIIRETADRGTAVFFSSHLLNDAEQMCEDLVILKSGVVAFSGATSDFLNQCDQGQEIVYQLNGEKKFEICLPDELNSKVKRLISEDAHIVCIKERSVSLEKAFINFNEGP